MASKLTLKDFGVEKLSDAVTEISPVQTARVSGKENAVSSRSAKQDKLNFRK